MTEPGSKWADSRMRVAFLIPSFAGGGAERVMIGFANGLPSDRFESHLFVLSSQGPLRSDLDVGVALHDLQQPRVRQAMPALVRWIRIAAPDVVITSAPHLMWNGLSSARDESCRAGCRVDPCGALGREERQGVEAQGRLSGGRGGLSGWVVDLVPDV